MTHYCECNVPYIDVEHDEGCRRCGFPVNFQPHYWVTKYEVEQQYGGPEEGGWWYDSGVPVEDWEPMPFYSEEAAYAKCRELNEQEYERQEKEERYDYTSVLSYRSTHYSYNVDETPDPQPYPKTRPHYE